MTRAEIHLRSLVRKREKAFERLCDMASMYGANYQEEMDNELARDALDFARAHENVLIAEYDLENEKDGTV